MQTHSEVPNCIHKVILQPYDFLLTCKCPSAASELAAVRGLMHTAQQLKEEKKKKGKEKNYS